jgi:hypothetical protein
MEQNTTASTITSVVEYDYCGWQINRLPARLAIIYQ